MDEVYDQREAGITATSYNGSKKTDKVYDQRDKSRPNFIISLPNGTNKKTQIKLNLDEAMQNILKTLNYVLYYDHAENCVVFCEI
jgi:hypothetical protein